MKGSVPSILLSKNCTKLYYITHNTNLNQIKKLGILPRNEVTRQGLKFVDISNKSVNKRRTKRVTSDTGKVINDLHDFVPLYFNDDNPMYYQIQNNRDGRADWGKKNVTILRIDFSVAARAVFYSDGNAANNDTKIYADLNTIGQNIDWDIVINRLAFSKDWKRKKMAEIFFKEVPPEYIEFPPYNDTHTNSNNFSIVV